VESRPDTTLAEFIRYNNWANQQVLAVCQKLSDEQLAATMAGAYGTIRDTLEHIVRSEAGYAGLLTGTRPQPSFKWEDRPALAEMTAFAAQVGQALEDAAYHLGPTDQVFQEWNGRKLHYEALAVFIQIINHGIEHRTNITTILSHDQQPRPDVDGWGYLWAHVDRFNLK
jgi:uncharacterized damage-inducible protein DinB